MVCVLASATESLKDPQGSCRSSSGSFWYMLVPELMLMTIFHDTNIIYIYIYQFQYRRHSVQTAKEKFRQMLHRDQSARLGELCSRSLPLIRRENAEIAVKLQELRTGQSHPVAICPTGQSHDSNFIHVVI